jgi:hypothetical protein
MFTRQKLKLNGLIERIDRHEPKPQLAIAAHDQPPAGGSTGPRPGPD